MACGKLKKVKPKIVKDSDGGLFIAYYKNDGWYYDYNQNMITRVSKIKILCNALTAIKHVPKYYGKLL